MTQEPLLKPGESITEALKRQATETEQLKIAVRDQAGVELSEENDRLIAEIEGLKRDTVSTSYHLQEVTKLEVKVERLLADLDILHRHYNLHPDAPLSREETFAAKDAEVERQRADNERLWDVLSWIDNFDPETTAAAETKFGLDLARRETKP